MCVRVPGGLRSGGLGGVQPASVTYARHREAPHAKGNTQVGGEIHHWFYIPFRLHIAARCINIQCYTFDVSITGYVVCCMFR